MTSGTPPQAHWEHVYRHKAPDAVSWYEPHATTSLALMRQAGLSADQAVIDVGGGAAALVDALLDAGLADVTVLDLSEAALAVSQARLGARAASVTWLAADITRDPLPAQAYDIWHDRAVLHFLLGEPARQGYRASLLAATHPGSLAVIGVFAPTGPSSCAGLPVRRHSEADLAAFLGPAFTVEATRCVPHVRPDGNSQEYVWVRARRASPWAAASCSGRGHEHTRFRSPNAPSMRRTGGQYLSAADTPAGKAASEAE